MIDIETTPDGATLVSVSEPLDYGLVADLAEVLASDSVREAHHIVIELAAPGSIDEAPWACSCARRATPAGAAAG